MRPSFMLRHSGLAVLFIASQLLAADIWSGPSFSADTTALRQAADQVKPGKHSPATVLLNDMHFSFDVAGRFVETRHVIYRVENDQGVENWSEISGQWEAWHQSKPEIKARVITNDGAEHWIDPKTLNDFPVHEDAPGLYTDDRKFGGPLPAVAPGAIVEEEIVTRDTAPLFSAGTVFRWEFEWSVPVNKTHVVIAHADSLPLHYQLHLLPDATVSKSDENGVETITIDQGPLVAYPEQPTYVPPDAVLTPEIEFATGTSWRQVAMEYARLSNEKLRTADVQPLLQQLNIKQGSRKDITRRIVASLHKNVRYTGVEFGESSLIPQFPSETLKRKYGDCKDKATLLVAMLQAAGIPARLALLDAGPGRDVNPDLPGVGMFDHAIVYVPASSSDSDLWIDATAQYTPVGTLPWMDYGRSALIIDPATESLKKIPELTADQNVLRELRVFTLAEYGDASIAEIDDEIGPQQADYREYYSRDSKEVRKNADDYVKEMYLADSVTSIDHEDLSDLDKPASIKFVTKGRRGDTDLNRAVAAIRLEGLFSELPKYFKTEETASANDKSQPADSSDKPQPRTIDWELTPFIVEWHYEVTAPLGFKLRALPSAKNENIDVLHFTQEYSANPEGTVVKAVLRVECTTARITAEQGKKLRDAVVKARNADPIFITFDQVGQSLIAAGKIKEGLEADRQIAAQHPKEALHRVQLAQALLTAGLGEEARVAAKEATALEPSSALAFSTLGMVLKHDQIGRLLKKGMDYDGAVAAYKKAVELDPKDKDTLANLALLLEYDADGLRYAENAKLKDAVAEFRALKKLDEDYERSYEDNILYDLWYAHDYQGVLDYAVTLPSTDVRKGLTLGSIAVLQGADAALNKSLELTTSEGSRSQALMNAGAVLIRVRKYSEAAAIFTEAAHGQANGSQIARSAAIFGKTRPYTELKIDPNDPRGVVLQLFASMLSGTVTRDEFNSLIYADPSDSDALLDQSEFAELMAAFRGRLRGADLPLTAVADLALSNIRLTADGDDTLGYKITVEAPGAASEDIFVVRDAGHYKIVAFSVANTPPEKIAFVALRELDHSNLPAAKKWLDRARDKISRGDDNDPLAGSPFPFFWRKGQDADPTAARLAALALLPSKELKNSYLATVIAARDATKNDLERAWLDVILHYAYRNQKKYPDTLPLAVELLKLFPASLRALELAEFSYGNLGKFDDWEKLVQARMSEHPDELAYVRSAARLAAYRGQFAKSREILKTIIDKGQATANDLNLYAWYALPLPGPIAQDAIDMAIRGTELDKNSFAIEHTLGCVYAQAGKTKEARELLLKAMDSMNLEEPNSELWFGFALIAEQYGALDAARKMYAKVEKPKTDYPVETYQLAQQHIRDLQKSPTKVALLGSK